MLDRLRDELLTFIQRALASVFYQAQHPATVRAQSADGARVDVVVDPPTRLPPLTGVPIRHGLPGVTVRVSPGARVGITFELGDPARPVATLWEAPSMVEWVVNGGERKAARDGDSVEVTIPIGKVMVAAPGPVPPMGTPVPNEAEITLHGTITNGTAVLKLP